MEIDTLIKRIDGLEERVKTLEGKQVKGDNTPKFKDVIDPKELENGRLVYAGKYKTEDCTVSSIFGSNVVTVDEILKYDATELANIIDAFSSVERINIIKELMKKSYTAKDLMENLNFSTTGKIYHHLSHLEKIGIIAKYNDYYHVSARFLGSIILIFEGAGSIFRKLDREKN